MRPPEELYTIHHDVTFVHRPILVSAFSGFVDAGSGVRLAAEHILRTQEHRLIATFDLDELFDYRARRPRMTFVHDHFATVDMPQISLHEVTDETNTPFLLLVGPEPDYQWQRFVAAVQGIVERFDVRMAVGLSAVPWPAPHTRPLGVTVHGSAPELINGMAAPLGEIEIPGHVSGLLELALGESGIPSMGITAQVPHYLAQFEYPVAAARLVTGLSELTGFVLPVDELEPASARAEAEIAQQLAGNEEFATVLAALEAQYDQGPAAAANTEPLTEVPTADEIAAQVEEFLQGFDDGPKA